MSVCARLNEFWMYEIHNNTLTHTLITIHITYTFIKYNIKIVCMMINTHTHSKMYVINYIILCMFFYTKIIMYIVVIWQTLSSNMMYNSTYLSHTHINTHQTHSNKLIKTHNTCKSDCDVCRWVCVFENFMFQIKIHTLKLIKNKCLCVDVSVCMCVCLRVCVD